MALSKDIQWAVIKNTSCFLRKQRGVRHTFSREPMNIRGINGYVNSGLIHKRAIGIEPGPENKGIVVKYRIPRYVNKPEQSIGKVVLTKDNRRILKAVKNIVNNTHNNRRYVKLIQIRASQILRSQKQKPLKKQKHVKEEKPTK